MICEKCSADMHKFNKVSVQGWSCPNCGWSILTTYIGREWEDITEYSIYIRNVTNINKDKIKLISNICGVNYIAARRLLLQDNACILRAKAPKIKEVIVKLEQMNTFSLT